jgi:hypothetical protein
MRVKEKGEGRRGLGDSIKGRECKGRKGVIKGMGGGRVK